MSSNKSLAHFKRVCVFCFLNCCAIIVSSRKLRLLRLESKKNAFFFFSLSLLLENGSHIVEVKGEGVLENIMEAVICN
jgi:hypothetical protein